jgi:hypothetical protein
VPFCVPLFPVPPVEGAPFCGGHFPVVIRVGLPEKCDLALVLGLKFGPTDGPIAVCIHSIQHPAHPRMTRPITLKTPARAMVIHRNSYSLGVHDAVGSAFGVALGAVSSAVYSAIIGRLGAGPHCKEQSGRDHDGNRHGSCHGDPRNSALALRQSLRLSGHRGADRQVVRGGGVLYQFSGHGSSASSNQIQAAISHG